MCGFRRRSSLGVEDTLHSLERPYRRSLSRQSGGGRTGMDWLSERDGGNLGVAALQGQFLKQPVELEAALQLVCEGHIHSLERPHGAWWGRAVAAERVTGLLTGWLRYQ